MAGCDHHYFKIDWRLVKIGLPGLSAKVRSEVDTARPQAIPIKHHSGADHIFCHSTQEGRGRSVFVLQRATVRPQFRATSMHLECVRQAIDGFRHEVFDMRFLHDFEFAASHVLSVLPEQRQTFSIESGFPVANTLLSGEGTPAKRRGLRH
jgi:hypothetical protein